ncbi:MAG: GAF domain-containing protein [Burkholderiaceae bacterium]|nr:GAF domain-containing protein [Microbacteriaceae bacterium]
MNAVSATLGRVIMRLWLLAAAGAWQDVPRPTGSTTAHSSGIDPIRLLLVGCGPAVGYGVLSHDLAIAGQLARQLGTITGQGVDVDVVAADTLTARSAVAALSDVQLARYDSIIVLVGLFDVIQLAPVDRWGRDMSSFLSFLEDGCAEGATIVVFGIPDLPASKLIGALPSLLISGHAVALQAELDRIAPQHSGTVFSPFPGTPPEFAGRAPGPSLYSALVAEALKSVGSRIDLNFPSVATHVNDEEARQEALERLGILDSAAGERLDQITGMARKLFGTTSAALTFLDHDRQWFMTVAGYGIAQAQRAGSFCDRTIRTDGPFIVPDATIDPRFLDHDLVAKGPRIRFYAGYPIMSPDGYRIGTFCLFDVRRRPFAEADVVLLRDLALRAQQQLWSELPARSR